MNGFFTSWAFLKILAVLALSNEMGSESTNFYSLAALTTNAKHGAGIIIMHIFIIFFDKPFIVSLTKLAILIFILELFLWNIDELVAILDLKLLWLLTRIILF